GEVAKPGRYQIDSEDMTILDMLGAAGDLTIYGERSNIKVLRRNGDKQDTYIVNLLSEKDLLNSPVYYVQQDDVIYVEPNPTRIRQSTL
ncbi:MAG: polysaccharide export protein, partial [Duncaniella sp.]|nr:polysaccharide export protein [Duncaniella sp.]